MTIERGLFAIIAGSVCLAGCAHDMSMGDVLSKDPTWGEANRQTMAAQVIDPEPDYTYEQWENSAELPARAVERYRTDRVTQPERVETGSVGSGGSR